MHRNSPRPPGGRPRREAPEPSPGDAGVFRGPPGDVTFGRRRDSFGDSGSGAVPSADRGAEGIFGGSAGDFAAAPGYAGEPPWADEYSENARDRVPREWQENEPGDWRSDDPGGWRGDDSGGWRGDGPGGWRDEYPGGPIAGRGEDWRDSYGEEGEDASALGGPEGNERLTAITGAILLVLFAAEGVTILRLGPLLYWHFFLGLLLIGPVCLKIASVLYRFTRYYTGSTPYLRKGPPAPLLRVLGPLVVLSTLSVLGTGVALGLAGQPTYAGLPLLSLHKLSFLGWFAVMTVHVLAYVWRLPRLIASDVPVPGVRQARTVVVSRGLRWSLVTACVLAGLVIAMLGAHLSANYQHHSGGPGPAKIYVKQ